jgi:hypothetical protein
MINLNRASGAGVRSQPTAYSVRSRLPVGLDRLVPILLCKSDFGFPFSPVTVGGTDGGRRRPRLRTALCRTGHQISSARGSEVFRRGNGKLPEIVIRRRISMVPLCLWFIGESQTKRKGQAKDPLGTTSRFKIKFITANPILRPNSSSLLHQE